MKLCRVPLRTLTSALALPLVLLAGCVISPRRDGTTSGGGGGGTPGPGKLYVSNEASNSILRFDGALTATGNVTPAATITNSSQILAPQFLLVDIGANRLYIASQGAAAVVIFDNASTRNGNITA